MGNLIRIFQSSPLVILLFLLIASCASAPDIYLPDPMPSAISEFKNLRIYGSRRKVDTGIYLREGDIYSILATGIVSRGGQRKFGPKSPNFQKYIGEDLIGAAFSWGTNGSMYEAPTSGWLYLGIRDSHPDDNTGAFNVVVILWKQKDYAQIAGFFTELKNQNPSNTNIRDATREADRLKKIHFAEEKATKELAEAKKEMEKLQQETGAGVNQKLSPVDQQRIQDLDSKMAQLTATLAELEEMKQELGLARKQAAQLSQQLEEKEKREKELMDKIASGTKNPPILLITSPADGLQTESKTVRLSGAAKDEQGLKQLNIFINNRLVDDSDNRGIRIAEGVYPRRLDMDRRIPLKKGENRIKIHVIDTDGLFTERSLTVHHIERRRNIWAVVVGINDYPHIRKLKYVKYAVKKGSVEGQLVLGIVQ